MSRLNERLRVDRHLHGELSASIKRYVADRESIEPLGATGHPGGGPDRVKCLHAHVAHHLITGDNPVGADALDQLGWDDPKEPCV